MKAEPLCDIERTRFDLFNKNNKMESKYTKGEWVIDKETFVNEHGQTGIQISTKGFYREFVAVWAEDEKDEQAKANALLIASAPELLEALEKVKFALDNSTEVDRKYWSKIILNAIKKAKGE